MPTEYTIIRNAPPPDRTVKYPWDGMAVNDAFDVPITIAAKGRCCERNRLASAAAGRSKRSGERYQVFKMGGVLRCRRTA